MVSCTDCVHYKVCEVWVDHNNELVDTFVNISNYKEFPRFTFPMVNETAEAMCPYYQKAKENVQP